MQNKTMYKTKINISNKQMNLITINYKPEREEKKIIDTIHHIHVIDRSYSMESNIDNLIDNVISTLDHIGMDDLLSVIWFSSADQCKTLLKGTNIHNKKLLIKQLDSIRSCNGLTCFSEPLKHVKEVINDLSDICPNFNVCFFTDGETVTDWTTEEENQRIMNELSEIIDKNYLLALNTIGYGNYYNQDLLIKMSEFSMYGKFNHSNNISDYSAIFTHEYTKIKNNIQESCVIMCPNSEILYTNLKDSKLTPNLYQTNFINKTKNQFFILTNESEFKINDEIYKVDEIKRSPSSSTLMNFYYAYAKELYYNGRYYEAIDMLTLTKDKYLVDKAINAFTRDERSSLIKKIEKAFINNSSRYLKGKINDKYLPSDNCYTVIQLLADLKSINATYIPVKNYNRFGKKIVEENSNFYADPTIPVTASMRDLVFNEKRLNISIRYTIYGDVILSDDVLKVGLNTKYKSKIYRMQTIIKDGNLNVPVITVELKDKANLALPNLTEFINTNKYISKREENNSVYHTYELNLTKLPVINRSYSNISIDEVLESTKNLLTFKTKLKVAKAKHKENNIEKIKTIFSNKFKDEFTSEQLTVLSEYGLNKDLVYEGTKNKIVQETTETYETRSIEFGIKGCSSIPAISASLKKREQGKKLNYLDEIICKTNDLDASNLPKPETYQVLVDEYSVFLFMAKLSKVLTGGWWHELEVTPKGTEEYTNDEFTLVVKTKRETVNL